MATTDSITNELVGFANLFANAPGDDAHVIAAKDSMTQSLCVKIGGMPQITSDDATSLKAAVEEVTHFSTDQKWKITCAVIGKMARSAMVSSTPVRRDPQRF